MAKFLIKLYKSRKLHTLFDEAGVGNGLTTPAVDPTAEVFIKTSMLI
ncbi:MAG: hypothetical protein ACETWQ_04190 [Phycisphaerae bacterium]